MIIRDQISDLSLITVLVQACKGLRSVVLRGSSSVDALTLQMLHRRGITVSVVPPRQGGVATSGIGGIGGTKICH
jgi:hypothetical protein